MNEFMVVVERVVRPVQAGPKKLLRMREELLAHLTAIYEEELARLGDEAAARAEAVRRFGDPIALTAELQQSLKWSDRVDARLNRSFGWRPGESGDRYSARLALMVGLLVLLWVPLALAVTAIGRRNDPTVPTTLMMLRLFGGVMVFAPLGVFVLSVLSIRIRDSLFGVFGSRRSWRRVVGLAALSVLVFPVVSAAFYWTAVPAGGEVTRELAATNSLWLSAMIYSFVPLWLVWFAWKLGPGQIRHVEWATLDIGR